MPGLTTGIHHSRRWMAGSSPAMTTDMFARIARAALRGLARHHCRGCACAIAAEPATMTAPAGESREHARPAPPPAHPARLILILSLAPIIGLGIGRFAYSLVLPDMRDSLGWSYSAAGFMNTINAAGYLAGALVAAKLIKRFGLAATVRWATLACVVALALCALSGNFIVLSFARLLGGVAAAGAFVGGAALAATDRAIAARAGELPAELVLCRTRARHRVVRPDRAVRAAGFRTGIVVDRLVGDDAAYGHPDHSAAAGADRYAMPGSPTHAPVKFSVRPVLIYLTGYFLFGAGYIAYMTFMIAYVRDAGGGAAAQSAFWCLIGLSAFVTPWVWRARAGARPRRRLHRDHSRRQHDRRGAAAVRTFPGAARHFGAGVRRLVLCAGRIDHGVRALQLSAGRPGRPRSRR